MKIQENFKQAKEIDTEINVMLMQLETLESLTTKVTAVVGNALPKKATPNVYSMEDTVIKIIDMKDEINETIDRLVDKKREISAMIATLADSRERIVLTLRYLEFFSFSQIAEQLEVSSDTVYRIHRNALKKFEK